MNLLKTVLATALALTVGANIAFAAEKHKSKAQKKQKTTHSKKAEANTPNAIASAENTTALKKGDKIEMAKEGNKEASKEKPDMNNTMTPSTDMKTDAAATPASTPAPNSSTD